MQRQILLQNNILLGKNVIQEYKYLKNFMIN
nr:MAG TPA: hypothetical protein [Caudoviricetes sp.]